MKDLTNKFYRFFKNHPSGKNIQNISIINVWLSQAFHLDFHAEIPLLYNPILTRL